MLSVYKQKKLQCALTLFVPGKWDKSGVLAGRCPIYNTQHVLAFMVWLIPASLWSVLCSCELWRVCAAGGDWVVGWVIGSTPVLQFWEERSWGGVAAPGRIVPEEHGCCSWFHVLPLCPALAPLLTHVSHTLAIPVCS